MASFDVLGWRQELSALNSKQKHSKRARRLLAAVHAHVLTDVRSQKDNTIRQPAIWGKASFYSPDKFYDVPGNIFSVLQRSTPLGTCYACRVYVRTIHISDWLLNSLEYEHLETRQADFNPFRAVLS